MGMSRWWMLGAVLPLVTGCGGSSSSDDDRLRFGVTYGFNLNASSPATVENDLLVFSRVDVTCTHAQTVDDVTQVLSLDLGLDAVQVVFGMTWINNDFDSQNITLTGDGFKVVIYKVNDSDGVRTEVWDSDFSYINVNAANGNDSSARYFESLAHSGPILNAEDQATIYDCDDDWQKVTVSEDSDLLADPFQFRHSGGDVIGMHSGVVVGDDESYEVIIPQSFEFPTDVTDGFRIGAGTYVWSGLDKNGDQVSNDATYEAELEARICVTGTECEIQKSALQFRVADKAAL